MRRVKVLFLPQEGVDAVWQQEVEAAVRPRTRPMYDAARDARLWHILGTGVDHVDISSMKTRGFAISNCPGQFSSVGLAECAMLYRVDR